jgi:hypothetical protein
MTMTTTVYEVVGLSARGLRVSLEYMGRGWVLLVYFLLCTSPIACGGKATVRNRRKLRRFEQWPISPGK